MKVSLVLVSEALFCKSAAEKINQIPLLVKTFKNLIINLNRDITNQLLDNLNGKAFSIQSDEYFDGFHQVP